MKARSKFKNTVVVCVWFITFPCVSQNIPPVGEIPAGDSIIIVYDAVINAGVNYVSNQATFNGSNFAPFFSNDPKTIAPLDSTVTIVDPSVVLPLSFISIKAFRNVAGIDVHWRVATEQNTQHYQVERSPDGRIFDKLATVAATANNGLDALYKITDIAPQTGINYYRIKAVLINNAALYSEVIKVTVRKENEGLVVYPNPTTGKLLNIQLSNLPKSKYSILLISNPGQVICEWSFLHDGSTATKALHIPYSLAKGVYTLVLRNGKIELSQQVICK
jgi:hypothetical protein